VKFLVDAHLPRRLVFRLRAVGYDAIHTLDLPNRNRTSDQDILAVAARESRIVVTKDADFVNSFILNHEPPKLLLISTGNITNAELEALLLPNLVTIVNGRPR
jgi:predicted nuclease of predicted toxin-antitoxin system